MYNFLLSGLLFFCLLQSVQAQQNKIPEELQQWIPWVLYEQEERTCTPQVGKTTERYCTWPSTLLLNVDQNGGVFTQKFLIETRSLVPLPGGVPFWPRQVRADGKNILVSKNGDHPAIWLDPGEHTVTGSFSWSNLPENLFIPPATGLVELTVHGKKVKPIQLDEQGRLWFKQQRKSRQNDEESLSLQVFRKVEDGVPLLQHLHIRLTVSGGPRQVTLGLTGDADFVPLQMQSPLPIRFDKQNRLQLQVRPGQWEIDLTLRNSRPHSPESMEIGKINGPWPDQEIWVFAANPKLRQMEISGAAAIDPSRTALPEGWKTLPAYLMRADSKMIFLEKNRGNPSPVPNRLSITRKFWLDQQGSGLTVLDSIGGTMTRDWRLNVTPPQSLGKVEVGGRARLITKLEESGKAGVEVRQGRLALRAESRINTAASMGRLVIPATGWDHNVQSLSAELNLPPGWKLLAASGVDRVSTWLTSWSLLDIFLVLIIALATGRILGWGWGLAAILTLTLCFQQVGSPRYLWLPLLAVLGLQRIISSETGKRLTRLSGLLLLLLLIVSSIPYMVREIQTGIFPQLEYGSSRKISQPHHRADSTLQSMPAEFPEDQAMAENAVRRSKVRRKPALASHDGMGKPPEPGRPQKIQIDPQEMIQTGPGLPDWNWTRTALHWSGPVKPEQEVSFYLLSPLVNSLLAFVRVLLLGLLLAGFLRRCIASKEKDSLPKTAKTSVILMLFLSSALSFPDNSNGEIPPPEILQELQDRLLAPPECGANCVSINSCLLSIEDDLLEITLHVDAQVRSAVTLPGKNRVFEHIWLDREKAAILLVNDRGFSTIRVEAGSHTIKLTKDLKGRSNLSLFFPTVPVHAQKNLQGWSVNGIRADGRLTPQISLDRLKTPVKTEPESKDNGVELEIPAFVQVERSLHMNLEWSVTTRVIRKSPDGVIALHIPLLPGEHVTSDGFHIADKHVRITMGPGQRVLSYHSSLETVNSLTLTAAETASWNEIWFLDVSPVWHVETEGFPEINQTSPAGKRYPEYHPYPGESLQLSIGRPQGVPGPTMTINRSTLRVKPGRRATETSLFFTLTASRGMQHSITLPPHIDLQKVVINNKEIPLQLENNRLTLPIIPGQQHMEIGWRSEHVLGSKTATERIDIGVESVNSSIEMQVPDSRWILLTGGPRIGPAVLFWGELLVFILVALFLGRSTLTPLSSLQWLLLSLGLSQIPVSMAAIVVAWLLLLGLRKTRGHEIKQTTSFNLMQVLLTLLSLAALITLFFAIQQGLLGHPDMQIGGNGSSGHNLYWYQDRIGAELPVAWTLTVPLLVYRIAMLLWALWLAMALLHWLRWGWDCFSSGGSWRASEAKKKKVAKNKKSATKKPLVKPSSKNSSPGVS